MQNKIEPGMRFGALVVKERDYSKNSKRVYWICRCDCGAIVSKAAQGLNNGETICCNSKTCPYKRFRGKDITGQKFGRLIALRPTNQRVNDSIVWIFQCECGNTKEIPAYYVVNSGVQSCGCLKQETDRQPKGNAKNEIGNKYGHLTVVARAGSNKNGQAMWECECDCIAKTHIVVLGNNLRRGHTVSCGCERRSHGELKVEQLLRENNISFIQEYRPFRFSSGAYASFDFYVNNQYIIEYDGITHYKYNLHGWHDEAQMKAQQERDIIKTQWCKDNNIPLIRIPYWRLLDLRIEDLSLETSQFIT